jgi:3-dehydro-L-gulonate 2-dehydrogenase
MRVPYEQMQAEFKRILLKHGFTDQKADDCATIFASNSLDGVYTHGLNRFPVFVKYIEENLIDKNAEPELGNAMGALERWEGHLGPGMLNARFCMKRATELAAEYGIGCVAIRNTNHWMRGGTYGWQAAEAGFIGICFTNTIANLPPWGGIDPRLGNNPLIIAVPKADGPVVLDMAVSQYSYGKLQLYQLNKQMLPLHGGYDKLGNLTMDPAAIIESQRSLPIGFWKGSGLSLALDLLVTILSQGRSTAKITESGAETGISQVFIAIKPEEGLTAQLIEQIIAYIKTSRPVEESTEVTYPGENTLKMRLRNKAEGIPVEEGIWQKVLEL